MDVIRRHIVQGIGAAVAYATLTLEGRAGAMARNQSVEYGHNSYRIFGNSGELNSFSGRTIDVPACYLAGASEWGVYQTPGAFEAMQHGACTRLVGVHLIEGAGHSLAEEHRRESTGCSLSFCSSCAGRQ